MRATARIIRCCGVRDAVVVRFTTGLGAVVARTVSGATWCTRGFGLGLGCAFGRATTGFGGVAWRTTTGCGAVTWCAITSSGVASAVGAATVLARAIAASPVTV